MGKQLEKKFTWVIENFSELKARKHYSEQFIIGGCIWRVLAFPKGNNVDHLSLYLAVADARSLPSGLRRHAKFRFIVVNQFSEQSVMAKETQHWFNARDSDWGFTRMMPFTELRSKNKGFLVNNKLIIEVEVDVLEVIGKLDLPEKPEKANEPLSNIEEPLVADAPTVGPQGDSPCEQEQKIVDASKEDLDPDASSALLNDAAGDISSLNPAEPVKEASETVENGVAECDNVASIAEVSNYLLKETQLEKETVDVNGFQVLSSQVKSVSQIFSKHPAIALDFRPKNKQLRTAYMNVLLSLIDTVCQSPQELSEDDLRDADDSLADLMDAGLKLDWLKAKLEEVSKTKKKEQAGGARLQEIGEELQKLKLLVSGLEAQLEKETAEISAAKAPLLFEDVV